MSLVLPRKKEKKAEGTLLDRISEADRSGQFGVDISHLELREWPQELLILSFVKEIKASSNKFATIPSLIAFRSLKALNLSRNSITDLSAVDFAALMKLKSIDLSRNCLTHLPEDITRLPLLEVLMIHRNQITIFPVGMENLKSCKVIDASYNDLSDVGGSLERMPNLEELNLGENPGLQVERLGTRTRRLVDKRALLASKRERRALITRALGIQKQVLAREQEVIFNSINQTAAAGDDSTGVVNMYP